MSVVLDTVGPGSAAAPGPGRAGETPALPSAGPDARSGETTHVREAHPSEYPALEDAIVTAYRASMEVSQEYEADMRRLAEHAAAYRIWVAVDQAGPHGTERVIGTVLTPRPDVPYQGHGEPEDERAFRLLTVAPEARGQGVGRVLITHAVREIARQGVRRVGIWTGAQMPAAVRLYESYGFERHRERETFTVDGGKVPLSFAYDVPAHLLTSA